MQEPIRLCLVFTRKDQAESAVFHPPIQFLTAEYLQFYADLRVFFCKSPQERRHPVFGDTRVSADLQHGLRFPPQKRRFSFERRGTFDIAAQIRQQTLPRSTEPDAAVRPLCQLHAEFFLQPLQQMRESGRRIAVPFGDPHQTAAFHRFQQDLHFLRVHIPLLSAVNFFHTNIINCRFARYKGKCKIRL